MDNNRSSKLMKILITILLIVFAMNATAQRKHIHISPSFRSGGWVVPALTLGGVIYFGAKAIQSNKYITIQEPHNLNTSYKNNPKRNGFAIYSAVCLAATIGIVITMQSDK